MEVLFPQTSSILDLLHGIDPNPSFRGVPFSASLKGNLVERKIGLLFEEDGGWVIVHYRTDNVSGEVSKQRFQSYREQDLWYYRPVREAARERAALSGLSVRTLLKNQ